jgi:endoglucanase
MPNLSLLRLVPLVLAVFCILPRPTQADERSQRPLWQQSFSSSSPLPGEGAGDLDESTGRAALRITRDNADGSSLRTLQVPVESLRGKWIYLKADLRADAVSAKPKDWNGIKVMLKLETPRGEEWPQISLSAGTFDWTPFSTRIFVPPDAKAAILHLGLEQVSGTAWFDNLRITAAREHVAPPAAAPDQPIFKGHSLPALRGAMAHPEMSREDLRVFAQDWGGNLLRWQLLHLPEKGADTDLAAYDRWLDRALVKLDDVIAWSREYGVKVVVDLHSPPGGHVSPSGVATSTGAFWTNPAAQQHFVEVWKKIAARYKKESGVIWGFDLLNEPDDRTVTPECDDWQTLAEKAARAIREIDPTRTLIVEPNTWGSAEGFEGFHPIPLPNVVYSFHMYSPFSYTHQGVDHPVEPLAYPGTFDGTWWDKAALEKNLAPAIAFAEKYHVHLYVGEFSALRWAPGADKYLADLTAIFESHGWDWSYHAYREWHGWNLELNEDRNDQTKKQEANPRREAILHWMKKNQPAK